jgi:hypothetical protein
MNSWSGPIIDRKGFELYVTARLASKELIPYAREMTVMMAHILLEYSSDGPPPSSVDLRVQEMGLARDGAFFVLEAATEEEMRTEIDRLHDALRGTGARYSITAGGPGDGEEASYILEPRPGEIENDDLEGRVEEVSSLLRSGGGSYDALLHALDIGEVELEGVLQEMVDRGMITAHRQEDGINYRLAGPMLRAMAR